MASDLPSGTATYNGKVIPVISMGRNGKMTRFGFRPADDAFVSMFDSARVVLRLALQDLGPVCIPNTNVALPGCVWPHEYLDAFGRALYERNVKIQILLSNPLSIPGGLKLADGFYGNGMLSILYHFQSFLRRILTRTKFLFFFIYLLLGWTCVDVAAEILRSIRKQFPKATISDLERIESEQLQVSFVRGKNGENQWEDGMTMGLHSKHFIVDDKCCYIGSQNLYVCDLAEWGVVLDDDEATEEILEAFWNPLWKVSYRPEDCDVHSVMDGLNIDRDGVSNPDQLSEDARRNLAASMKTQTGRGYKEFGLEGSIYMPSNSQSFYLEENLEMIDENAGRVDDSGRESSRR